MVTPSVLVQPSTQTFFGVRHAFLQQDARRAIRTSSCETGPCRNRLRAVPLQSVESKLGRTGESENSFSSASCFFAFARFPRSRDHFEGLPAVYVPKVLYTSRNRKSVRPVNQFRSRGVFTMRSLTRAHSCK